MMLLSIYGSDGMNYYRYGKLSFSDLGLVWFVCAFLFLLGGTAIVFSIIDFLSGDLALLGVFLIVFTFVFFFSIFKKTKEQFFIEKNVLSILNFGKRRDIILPSCITVIIAHADFMPPLATRSPSALHMRQTIALNDRYEAILLEGSLEEDIIPVLCRYHYSSSHIEEAFENRFIYSFVCNQEILDSLLMHSECNLIVPYSLSKRLIINKSVKKVFIDNNY